MFSKGDKVFIILNNSNVAEVQILNISGNLYTLKFLDSDKGIRLHKSRLFKSFKEAVYSAGLLLDEKDIKPPMLH